MRYKFFLSAFQPFSHCSFGILVAICSNGVAHFAKNVQKKALKFQKFSTFAKRFVIYNLLFAIRNNNKHLMCSYLLRIEILWNPGL